MVVKILASAHSCHLGECVHAKYGHTHTQRHSFQTIYSIPPEGESQLQLYNFTCCKLLQVVCIKISIAVTIVMVFNIIIIFHFYPGIRLFGTFTSALEDIRYNF